MRRTALAAAVAVAGVALAAVLLSREPGGIARERVEVPGATAAVLDTVAVRGRVVQASLDGVVVQAGRGGEVWVASGGDAFAVRFPAGAGLEVEDRVLATGRLRARGGRRWLEATSWARVEASVRAPSGPAP